MTESLYVYAILASGMAPPAGLQGLHDRPVEFVQYEELSAATSLIARESPEITAEDALRHEAVVEVLQGQAPILPVRFGTVLPDCQALIRALAEGYAALRADLARLAGTVEYGVTVLWKSPIAETTREEPAAPASRPDDISKTNGPGRQYLQARLAEHQRDAAWRAQARDIAATMDSRLRPHSLESRWTIRPGSRIAARAAYLLQHETAEAFQEAFEACRSTLPDYRFLLSGPWPPYTFVTAPESSEVAADGCDQHLNAQSTRR